MLYPEARRDPSAAKRKAVLNFASNLTGGKMIRSGGAALVAAVVSLLLVSDYHPCDGIGPLMILTPVVAGIAIVSGLPGASPRKIIVPGAVAITVFAVAIGIDYSSSGFVSPSGTQCEPVPGIAGFALAFVWVGVLGAVGLGAAMLLAWGVNSLLLRQQEGSGGPTTEAGAE